MPISAERLRAILSYNPETGVFTNKIPRKRIRKGAVAGCIKSDGRVCIGIDGQVYRAHQLAWLYMTGEWPDGEIDHINVDPGDNRFCNLRISTRSQNVANSGKRSTNTSGYKGVTRRGSKWVSQITHAGVHHYLGIFSSAEDAHEAYAMKAKELFGEHARAA